MYAWALINSKTGKIRQFCVDEEEDRWALAIFKTKKALLNTLDVDDNEEIIRVEVLAL